MMRKRNWVAVQRRPHEPTVAHRWPIGAIRRWRGAEPVWVSDAAGGAEVRRGVYSGQLYARIPMQWSIGMRARIPMQRPICWYALRRDTRRWPRERAVSALRREIRRRGGEDGIDDRVVTVVDSGWSEGAAVLLLHCEAKRRYTSEWWWAGLSYLCGWDDSGAWAVRIPRTIKSVAAAAEWLQPPMVRRARKAGRRVLRQGNLYLVEVCQSQREIARDRITGDPYDYRCPEVLGCGNEAYGDHRWWPHLRCLTHPEHQPLEVPPGRWVAVEQKALRTSRGGAAD